MNKELMEALDILEREKEISKETLFEAIENSLLTACKNHFGKADNVRVEIDRETCDFLVYAEKEVVPTEEEVEDNCLQISLEDAREISETLLSGRTVILNLEGLDLEIAQRIIDFTSGSTFAIDGNLQKISNYIFLVTPTNVDISGDLQNLLGTSIDASPIGGGY